MFQRVMCVILLMSDVTLSGFTIVIRLLYLKLMKHLFSIKKTNEMIQFYKLVVWNQSNKLYLVWDEKWLNILSIH